MKLGDLYVFLALSSEKSDMRRNEMGNFESKQRVELFECRKKTVSACLIRISEYRINSKNHGSRRGEI